MLRRSCWIGYWLKKQITFRRTIFSVSSMPRGAAVYWRGPISSTLCGWMAMGSMGHKHVIG